MMEWSSAQQEVLRHRGSVLVVGMAGSGKTSVLEERAARLASAGKKVALVTFSFRGLEYLKTSAQVENKALQGHITAGRVRLGTLRDLAQAQLTAAGQNIRFISNNQMREVIAALMVEQSFAGTAKEAEHIIRAAKGRARKLPDNDRHYGFVMAYQQKLEALGMQDRHDLIRRHVLGMKEGAVPPVPVDHVLLDNAQDATELQLIWLQMHLNAGVELTLAVDDDATVFTRDGALGPDVVTQVEDWADVKKIILPGTFRLPSNLTPAIIKVARQLRNRIGKGEEALNAAAGSFQAESFSSASAEHAFLTSTCSRLLAAAQKGGGQTGVITRDQFTAALIAHVLRRAGMNPAVFARNIWENPTPQLVLAMLYVMLGQGSNAHLQLVMLGFGLPPATVMGFFTQGLQAEGWLQRGCPLPSLEGMSPTLLVVAQKLRRAFAGAWQLLQARNLSPREIFKSLVADMLEHLPEAEHPQALLATDMLLSLSGKLTEILPRVMQETLPDMNSPIIVAPVREVRNMQFATVILPHAGANSWPQAPHTLLGPNPEHERRMFYLAVSRTQGNLILTWHTPQPTPYLSELQQNLKTAARKG